MWAALVYQSHSLTSEIQHSPPASSTLRTTSSLLNVLRRQKISPTMPMSGRGSEKSAGTSRSNLRPRTRDSLRRAIRSFGFFPRDSTVAQRSDSAAWCAASDAPFSSS